MKMITVQTTVNAPIKTVWECWNSPKHLNEWVHASDDWESKNAKNDLHVGGKLVVTLAAKNGSEQFDFVGTYTAVEENTLTELDLDDGRHVKVTFEQTPNGVTITEMFEPESQHSQEVQRQGWQAILDSFKKYTEQQVRS